MPWYEVVISNSDVASEIADSLMRTCRRAVLESEIPSGAVHMYQGRNERSERVFYFYFASPPPEPVVYRLEQFAAEPCPQPDLEHFTRLEFP